MPAPLLPESTMHVSCVLGGKACTRISDRRESGIMRCLGAGPHWKSIGHLQTISNCFVQRTTLPPEQAVGVHMDIYAARSQCSAEKGAETRNESTEYSRRPLHELNCTCKCYVFACAHVDMLYASTTPPSFCGANSRQRKSSMWTLSCRCDVPLEASGKIISKCCQRNNPMEVGGLA